MATHSSILAWRIPGMGEPGGLPSQAGAGPPRLSAGRRGREICSPAQPRLHRNPHLFRILFQKQFKPHPPQSLTQGVFTPTLLGPLVKSE